VLLAAGCQKSHDLLLTVRSAGPIDTLAIKVKDTASGSTVLERSGEKVDLPVAAEDPSVSSLALKVAIEFSHAGSYLVFLRGTLGSVSPQAALRLYAIDGITRDELELRPVASDDDGDGDGVPRCGGSFDGCDGASCDQLDCNDKDPFVGPFGRETCGNGKDDDCSAGCDGAGGSAGDEACADADGDGASGSQDCDDSDPCRASTIKEEKNFCKTEEAVFPLLPQTCLDKLAAEGKTLEPPYCGDGIDEDCNGSDVACVTDEDCDGYPAAKDCDDKDPKVNPAAVEVCDGKDNNCDGKIDEGCYPCDVDGDGYAAIGNRDPSCKLPKTDPDDLDSGINPGTTSTTSGAEGGSVLGALRETCSTRTVKNSTTRALIRERDVDHDGDGLAASEDGCPSLECDADGDGFMNASCSPPKSKLDCDDTDPHTFPGAPDKCGDGIAQNCISDSDCSCDKDGDGYCSPDDCNDSDATIHPWATEVCDHVDNDCDGLTDEGNPDASGKPIDTNVKLCNDDNDGECAPACSPAGSAGCSSAGKTLSGVCACSAVTPTSTRDKDNRVACTGEDLSASASPRCFGATQPTAELCNGLDDNCKDGTTDDGAGECSSSETCCTGGCKDLKTDASSCGQCDEACTVDSDTCVSGGCVCGHAGTGACASGLTCTTGTCSCDTGSGSACKGCCDGTSTCVGLGSAQSSTLCGKGGALCQSCDDGNDCTKSDLCSATGVCTHTNAANGTACTGTGGSSGKCLSGTCCTGCVSGSTCAAGTSKSVCGSGGAACTACSAVACKAVSCSSGSCDSSTAASDGTACTGGTCVGGTCCTGCVSGSSCLTGDKTTACGKAGASCSTCSANETCTAHVCTCTGCLSGGTCYAGTSDARCGKDGAACASCTSPKQCKAQVCK
jgi:hypothetical protein